MIPALPLVLGILIIYFVWCLLVKYARVDDLEHKAVLITGCDSGFGYDLALKCLQMGMPVFAGCLTEQGLEQLEYEWDKLRKNDGLVNNLKAFLLDVRSQESVDAALKFVEENLEPGRGLYALVNNAGIAGETAWDDWLCGKDYENVLQVNTIGVIRVTHAFKQLVKAEYGRIVTMASIMGRVALPAMGPYSVSKFAVEAYCDIIRVELVRFGVKVCILEPGFFKTPMTSPENNQRMLDRIWSKVMPKVKEEYGSKFYEFTRKRMVAHLSKASTHTEYITNAYVHAITARWPHQRYQLGWDAKLFLLLAILPTWLQDVLFLIVTLIEKPLPPMKKGKELLKFEGVKETEETP